MAPGLVTRTRGPLAIRRGPLAIRRGPLTRSRGPLTVTARPLAGARVRLSHRAFPLSPHEFHDTAACSADESIGPLTRARGPPTRNSLRSTRPARSATPKPPPRPRKHGPPTQEPVRSTRDQIPERSKRRPLAREPFTARFTRVPASHAQGTTGNHRSVDRSAGRSRRLPTSIAERRPRSRDTGTRSGRVTRAFDDRAPRAASSDGWSCAAPRSG